MKILYDPECERIARYFLEDVDYVKEDDIQNLAGTIQHAIEQWIFSFEADAIAAFEAGARAAGPEDDSGQGDEG